MRAVHAHPRLRGRLILRRLYDSGHRVARPHVDIGRRGDQHAAAACRDQRR